MYDALMLFVALKNVFKVITMETQFVGSKTTQEKPEDMTDLLYLLYFVVS